MGGCVAVGEAGGARSHGPRFRPTGSVVGGSGAGGYDVDVECGYPNASRCYKHREHRRLLWIYDARQPYRSTRSVAHTQPGCPSAIVYALKCISEYIYILLYTRVTPVRLSDSMVNQTHS